MLIQCSLQKQQQICSSWVIPPLLRLIATFLTLTLLLAQSVALCNEQVLTQWGCFIVPALCMIVLWRVSCNLNEVKSTVVSFCDDLANWCQGVDRSIDPWQMCLLTTTSSQWYILRLDGASVWWGRKPGTASMTMAVGQFSARKHVYKAASRCYS